MPLRKAGRSFSSMFHTFRYRHITWNHRGQVNISGCKPLQQLFCGRLLQKKKWTKPRSRARSKEIPHRRTTRSLSWKSSWSNGPLALYRFWNYIESLVKNLRLCDPERLLQSVSKFSRRDAELLDAMLREINAVLNGKMKRKLKFGALLPSHLWRN